MNMYSAYLPFSTSDASGSTNTDYLNDFLLLQLASLIASSSDSLNGKRPLFPQECENLDELSMDSVAAYKKLKGNDDHSSVIKSKNEVPIRKINSKFSQLGQKGEKVQVSPKNIIVLDEEEDCLAIAEPSSKPYKESIYRPNPVFFDDYLDSFHNLSNQLSFITDNQKANLPYAKQSEIIILDNDEEDQLTCDSTPLIKQDSLSSDTESVQHHVSDKSIESFEEVKKEVLAPASSIQCAKIPSFELSVVRQKQRKVRQVKSVWKPSEVFESWVEQIGKTVGIQITNQEKVLKTMKNFDMNLEIALEKIRRSKAHYKDYFRVKKFDKH